MLDTQTLIEDAPASRRARRDESPDWRIASPTAGADAPLEILFDAEVPATPHQDSSIGAYLHEVRRHPLMTPETEHDVAVRFRATADPRLAAQLVNANLRLVIKIAKEHRRAHNQLSDLVQEGNLGLIQAVGKYDPSRGVKFASYASWWIRAYILKFVMSNYRLVKLGTTQAQRRLFFNLRKEREKLERKGLEVSPKQLAAALDVTEEEVVEMARRLDASDASLDVPPRGERERTVRDIAAAPESRPDVNVESSEFKTILVDKLHAFGATLRGRDLAIFNDRLFNDEPLTLAQLAARFGLSRERIHQLESRLKHQIREYLEDEIDEIDEIGAIRVAQ